MIVLGIVLCCPPMCMYSVAGSFLVQVSYGCLLAE